MTIVCTAYIRIYNHQQQYKCGILQSEYKQDSSFIVQQLIYSKCHNDIDIFSFVYSRKSVFLSAPQHLNTGTTKQLSYIFILGLKRIAFEYLVMATDQIFEYLVLLSVIMMYIECYFNTQLNYRNFFNVIGLKQIFEYSFVRYSYVLYAHNLPQKHFQYQFTCIYTTYIRTYVCMYT